MTDVNGLMDLARMKKAEMEAAIDRWQQADKALILARDELETARRVFHASRTELLHAVYGEEPSMTFPRV